MPRRITREQIEFIRDNYLEMSGSSIATELGINKSTVNRIKRENGWKVSKDKVNKWRAESSRGRTTFTEEEDQFIKDNYLKIPVKAIARKLKRSGCGVSGRMNAMGLVVPKELNEQRKKASEFLKGKTPWNKGKKQSDYMSAEAIERTRATQFKKGNKPHNTKYDGCISERADKSGRKYKYIRVSEGNWILLQRKIWEEHNGKIPDKHKIIFMDGNSLNCEIDNLFMVTEAELMGMNSIMRYPENIRKVIRLNARLNNIIKKKENG